jgi:hypothetical protein
MGQVHFYPYLEHLGITLTSIEPELPQHWKLWYVKPAHPSVKKMSKVFQNKLAISTHKQIQTPFAFPFYTRKNPKNMYLYTENPKKKKKDKKKR